ncbi:MAG: glutathione peroxidase [Bacteroidales bacterium]|nr:glutathione peroxidase [Bacteroidales bacterium]
MKIFTHCLILMLITLPALVSAQKSFHDFTVRDIEGFDYKLSQFKGKKVLVVNTASKCGLTPQYEDLERLYREYGDNEFVIVGFPSNDFASQEPGSNEEIAIFCSEKYEVSFPLMSKISVKGEEIHPVYQWLTEESENGVEDSKVAWNFQKYLIDEQGALVGHVPPRKNPYCREIIQWLENN